MESVGNANYGIFDVADLSADRTYTFPDKSGTVAMTSDIINYDYWLFAVDGAVQDQITSTDTLDFVSGSDIDITRSAEDKINIAIETTLDTVSTINLADNGTINGLDQIDNTTETTLEGALDIAGDITGTGLNSVQIAANVVDDNELVNLLTYTGDFTLAPSTGHTGLRIDASSAGTTGINGADINFTQSDDADASDNNSALSISVNSASDNADNLYGLNINTITAGAATETAIAIGANWDYAFNLNGTLLTLSEVSVLDGGISISEVIGNVVNTINGGAGLTASSSTEM